MNTITAYSLRRDGDSRALSCRQLPNLGWYKMLLFFVVLFYSNVFGIYLRFKNVFGIFLFKHKIQITTIKQKWQLIYIYIIDKITGRN